MQVVLDTARRAAMAERCKVPEKLSCDAEEAWRLVHFMLGGNPRLLSYALEAMGKRGGPKLDVQQQQNRAWNTGTLCPCSLHLVALVLPWLLTCTVSKEWDLPFC